MAKWWVKALCALGIVGAINSQVAIAEDQYVNASGEAAIEGSNPDAAQKKALADAFRNAVEKGLGVWVKSETSVQDFQLKKDEILTRAEGYVTEHEIVKEGAKDGVYTVVIRAKVAVDKIGADIKQMVGRVKTQMGNPAISFVLTTWENKGIRTSANYTSRTDQSLKTKASDSVQTLNSLDTDKESSLEITGNSPNMSAQSTSTLSKQASFQKIDENLWKKYPDMTIIDAFQQEFNEKGFDLKAADKAREISLSESLAQTALNINDRQKIRSFGEKEGANFIARGEVQILDSSVSAGTGNYQVTSKVGVEIIDVNSGDIVASYSNTTTASSSSEMNAKAQAIKKIAVLAAKTLASQTIDKWQERALTGRRFSIELQNMTSIRQQKMPFIKALQSVAQITSQTSPQPDILLLDVLYKGDKNALGEGILEQIGELKGFSESEFDGPIDESGKIIFKFTKKKK